jgi:hypothetical protein
MTTAVPRSALGWCERSSLLARVVPVADRQGGAALYIVPLNESGLMKQVKRRKDEPNPTTMGLGGCVDVSS